MTGRLGREDGQVLPLLAAGLLVVLLGFAALVVDLGRVYTVKRQLQSMADAAALAAADSLPDASAAQTTADAYGPNGKNPPSGGVTVTQTVTPWCLKSVTYCYSNPVGAPATNGQANGVVVTEQATVPMTFASVFGMGSMNVKVRSTACALCAGQPLDIALVLDRTASMSANMADLRNGVKTLLGALDPRFDYVTLLVLPPLWSGGTCAAAPSSYATPTASFPFYTGYAYPATSDDQYTVVRMSQDYRNTDGTLNTSSALVNAVNCVQPGGGTAYMQALTAAQRELTQHGSGRANVKRVIIFESDGAANHATETAYDKTKTSYKLSSTYIVYQSATGRDPEVVRPCGAAVDYANNTVKPSGTTIFTVGYNLGSGENCFQAPHAYRDPSTGKMAGVSYKEVLEGINAQDALAQIASPGGAVTQATAGDMSAAFATVADKLQGAQLVPDSEAS